MKIINSGRILINSTDIGPSAAWDNVKIILPFIILNTTEPRSEFCVKIEHWRENICP